MSKSNVINILKTQYEIYGKEFSIIFLLIFIISFIFSGNIAKLPVYFILINLLMLFVVFYFISIKNSEKFMYLSSGCSRKELYISEFIIHIILSILIILSYGLTSSFIFGLNNIFFVNINIVLILLALFNIFSCSLTPIVSFIEKQKNKSYLLPIEVLIFLRLIRLFREYNISNHNISEEFLSSSNFIAFVFLYILSLLIYLFFNRYNIANQDFKL